MRKWSGWIALGRVLGPGGYTDVILSDINPKALRYSQINARLNGIANIRTILSDVFDQINEGGNLIVSNPPYLVDHSTRLYRHGGGELGFDFVSASSKTASIACIRAAACFSTPARRSSTAPIRFSRQFDLDWNRGIANTPTKRSIRMSSGRRLDSAPTTVPTA